MEYEKDLSVSVRGDEIIISQDFCSIRKNGTMQILKTEFNFDIEEAETLIAYLQEAIGILKED